MKGVACCVILLSLSFGIAYAGNESVLITYSPTMERVIFDGKWTNYLEWKNSSWNDIHFVDEGSIHLRTAHYKNFIYVFIDAVIDHSLDLGKDSALICFDTKNNKAEIIDEDDYCFSVSLGENEGITLKGGLEKGDEKINNLEGFIAISSVSDENDRYSKIPHPGYEFRIPTDLVGRSNTYGFFVSVYDQTSNKTYSWPTSLYYENYSSIPAPNRWGELISPDSSLPEFEWPFIALIPAMILVIIIAKLQNVFN